MAPWCGSGSTARPPQSCSWSCSVREDGQKVLLAVKNMGGETSQAWRTVLDDLVKRGLRKPEFLICRWRNRAGAGTGCAVGRCPHPTLHRPQAPQSPRPRAAAAACDISADYNDMVYATSAAEIEQRGGPSSANGGQMQGGR